MFAYNLDEPRNQGLSGFLFADVLQFRDPEKWEKLKIRVGSGEA